MDKKQEIIDEYLSGNCGYRHLAKKYRVPATTLHRWVKGFQGLSQPYMRGSKAVISFFMKKSKTQEDLPQDIKTLQKELIQERLRNKLLTAMIDVAEEQLKIPIRKKYGTKPLKK